MVRWWHWEPINCSRHIWFLIELWAVWYHSSTWRAPWCLLCDVIWERAFNHMRRHMWRHNYDEMTFPLISAPPLPACRPPWLHTQSIQSAEYSARVSLRITYMWNSLEASRSRHPWPIVWWRWDCRWWQRERQDDWSKLCPQTQIRPMKNTCAIWSTCCLSRLQPYPAWWVPIAVSSKYLSNIRKYFVQTEHFLQSTWHISENTLFKQNTFFKVPDKYQKILCSNIALSSKYLSNIRTRHIETNHSKRYGRVSQKLYSTVA